MNRLPNRALPSAVWLIAAISWHGLCIASPPDAVPAAIDVSREMIDTGKISRFQLEVKREANGLLHVTVICPKREEDHLANATLEFLQEGIKPVDLPIKVTVDNSGDDRLVFSTSSETAMQCLLSLYIGPKISPDKKLKPNAVYKIMLADFVPPKEPAPAAPPEKKN